MDCKRLKEARVAAGITQGAMAAAIGYKDKSSYCLLEKGAVKCTVDQAKVIKEVLGLSLEMYSLIFLT